MVLLLAVIVSGLLPPVASGYKLSGYIWEENTTHFSVSHDGGAFDDAFISAMKSWNCKSSFNFTWSTSTSVNPCGSQKSPDRKNSYGLMSTYCGEPWGATTLGITKFWYGGLGGLIDADIVFNANKSWGFHDDNTASPFDFLRIAAHELGHAIGFRHENSGVATIMKPSYDPLIRTLQEDDLNGLKHMYSSGSSNTHQCQTFLPALELLLGQ